MDKRIPGYLLTLLLAVPGTAGAQSGTVTPAAQRPPAGNAVLRLGLKQAVEIALGVDGNARVQLAREFIRQAQALSAQSRAALLPNVDSSVGYLSQTRNLEAFGIRIQLPIPGFSFPTFVGPYSVFDARITATQSLFDLSAIKRYQASRTGISLAEAEQDNIRNQIRAQVARAYLDALRSQADQEAAGADVRLAEALLELARDRKAAGTGTGIEVTRAQVQLSNEKQRLLVAQNGLRRAHLQLLKVMGLDLDVDLELTDTMSRAPLAPVTLEEALELALASRADWKAEQLRQETLRMGSSAIKMERLPSVSLFADYGSIGSGIGHTVPTRTYGFSVRIPIFDGGRRDARRSESYSQLSQGDLRLKDLRAQIELDIRLALDSLGSSADQLKTAEEGLALANTELAQAERRYRAGVGTNIELTDAQTRLERARENATSALYGFNMAHIDLRTATGTIAEMIQ